MSIETRTAETERDGLVEKRMTAHELINQLSEENLDLALLALQIPAKQEIKDRQVGYRE